MTKKELGELRAAAEAAVQNYQSVIDDRLCALSDATIHTFASAANPHTVLRLISRIEEMERNNSACERTE